MRTITKMLTLLLATGTTAAAQQINAPDTITVNTPLKITTKVKGAKTYNWRFCSESLFQEPVGVNLGTIASAFRTPVFFETISDHGNFYQFVSNHPSKKVTRLSYGNSLLNTPSVYGYPYAAEMEPFQGEGIQVVKDERGEWHIITVGGDSKHGSKVMVNHLGDNIENNSPKTDDWGNVGEMAFPTDLFTWAEKGNWYALTVNSDNNSLTRLDFGNSLYNKPKGENLGNVGDLDFPTGMFVMKEAGSWYMFVANTYSNTISRLDFGKSLLNRPTGENLGNAGGWFNRPRDLSIINDGGRYVGIVINEDRDDLTRIEFLGGLKGRIKGVNYGNKGKLDFPVAISPMFREKDKMFAFITNATDHTMSRLIWRSGNSSTISEADKEVPPVYTYDEPGVYRISLVIDEGLPTRAEYVKYIVVKAK